MSDVLWVRFSIEGGRYLDTMYQQSCPRAGEYVDLGFADGGHFRWHVTAVNWFTEWSGTESAPRPTNVGGEPIDVLVELRMGNP